MEMTGLSPEEARPERRPLNPEREEGGAHNRIDRDPRNAAANIFCAPAESRGKDALRQDL